MPGPRMKLFMSAASSSTARCRHCHHCQQLTSLFLARDPYLGCTLATACCCHSDTDPVITLIFVSAMSACLRSRHTRQHSCQLQPVNYSISNISALVPARASEENLEASRHVGEVWGYLGLRAQYLDKVLTSASCYTKHCLAISYLKNLLIVNVC